MQQGTRNTRADAPFWPPEGCACLLALSSQSVHNHGALPALPALSVSLSSSSCRAKYGRRHYPNLQRSQ